MSGVADAETRARWQVRGDDCSQIPNIEDVWHARYTLTAHSGHRGCRQFLTALDYVVLR